MAGARQSRASVVDTRNEWCWDGVFIAVMSFSIVVLWGSIYKSFGVLLPTLTEQFTSDTWLIGTTISGMSVASSIAGLFTVVLEDHLGTRPVLVLSTSMVGFGMLLIPLATRLFHISMAITILVGPGLGFLTVLNKSVLARHFTNHYTFASGISHSGTSLAFLVFAPLMQLFLDTYGWRGATLLLGGICLHPIASTARVRLKRPLYHPLSDQPRFPECNDSSKRSIRSLCAEVTTSIDFKLLLEFKFWMAYLCLMSANVTNTVWVIFYVPHLQTKGISPQVATLLVSVTAAGYIAWTVLIAPFIDRRLVDYSKGIIVASLIVSASLVVDPWINSILLLAVSTFIFGIAISALFTLDDVLTKDLLGSDRMTSAYGWIGLLGMAPVLISGFLPAWIYDTSGSYDLAFVTFGLLPIVVLPPLLIGKFKKKTAEEQAQETK